MSISQDPVVDAHLDMAYNVLRGRDLRLSPAQIRELEDKEEQSCMVTIPELSAGGIGVIFASIFVQPTEFPEGTDHAFDPVMAERLRKKSRSISHGRQKVS